MYIVFDYLPGAIYRAVIRFDFELKTERFAMLRDNQLTS